MGDLIERIVVGAYEILFEENRDSRRRLYFSATVQLPGQLLGAELLILDDRILPRLKRTISEVLKYREIVAASA